MGPTILVQVALHDERIEGDKRYTLRRFVIGVRGGCQGGSRIIPLRRPVPGARLNPDSTSCGIMVPHPGTKVYEMAITGEGNYRLTGAQWSEYVKFGGGGLELKNLSRNELERLQRKAYLSFYFKNYRFIDFISYGWEHREQVLAVLRKLVHGKTERFKQG